MVKLILVNFSQSTLGSAGMEPLHRAHRRLVMFFFHHILGLIYSESAKFLAVPLLHAAEAPELPLLAIIIAVMIAVGAGIEGFPYLVFHFDITHHVNRERAIGRASCREVRVGR